MDLEKRASSGSSDRRRRLSGLAVRAAVGVLLVLGLGGPSPGHLGSCGATSAADPVQFCTSKETYVCARECGSGRWDAAMRMTMCGTDAVIASRCAGFGFPPGCLPTQVQASACFEALRNPDRLGTPFLDITECNSTTLCSSSALTSTEPEGI